MASIQVKRGTRAQLEAAKPASGLAEGEPYLITDEGRLAVGTAANAYSDAALKSEVDAKLPLISGQSEINDALADDDVFAAYDTSATAHKKSLMSRVWTYISGKITGAISGVLTSNLTASRAVVSDGSGKVSASSVTSTELGYLSGVTSALQTQINAKSDVNGSNSFPSFQYSGLVSPDGLSADGNKQWVARGGVQSQWPSFVLECRNDAGEFVSAAWLTGRTPTHTAGLESGMFLIQTPVAGVLGIRFCISPSGNTIINSSTDDASGAKLQINGTVNLASGNAYKINNQQVVGARQAAISNASVSYTTGNLDTEAEIITALNTTNGKINSILHTLRTHGLIAP